jgi:hypothetical protein
MAINKVVPILFAFDEVAISVRPYFQIQNIPLAPSLHITNQIKHSVILLEAIKENFVALVG